MPIDIVKIFIPSIISFCFGTLVASPLGRFLKKHEMWKKKSVAVSTDGGVSSITQKLHNDEERKLIRMGGIVVWGSALFSLLVFRLGAIIFPSFAQFNFLSRNQTWLPVFSLIVGAGVGLIDDYFTCRERYDQKAGGLSFWKRSGAVFAIAAVGAWWFYYKLGVSSIYIPFAGDWNIGWFFIPFFIAVMLGTFSGGVIDGLDGLSGGVFSIIFGTYGMIAFLQNQYDLAAFCFVLVGGLLAFLWFNIPPALFMNSETGIMALTTTLAVVAFLTGQVMLLPLIAFPLVISSGSSQIQLLSKKFRGKKVFLVAPLHHHFQAKGYPAHTVVMRYWIMGIICGLLGLVLAILG